MFRRTLVIGAGVAALALMLLPMAAAADDGGFFHHPGHGFGHPTPGSAVVSMENGMYGPVLVVGGAGAGYIPASGGNPAAYAYPAGSSLYYPTIDPLTYGASFFHQYQPGCTTTLVNAPTLLGPGPISCTGSETDPTADWPAFTTEGPPVAGPGVNPHLLNAVYRTDLGAFQVTYAGHPLYLFDPSTGGSFFGANFYETTLPLPPWATAWFLISPWGTPATGPATVETEAPQPGSSYSTTKLATNMLPGFGGIAVSVYSFSGDSYFSHCYGACARDFIPVTTVGAPVPNGVNASAIGTVWRADGTRQVTYNGHPLYIYSQEEPIVGGGGPSNTGTTGNGDGVSAFGGTFSLVNP
jgi:predicted lipoprotein with Yx(FWY)xxD motif